MDLKSYSHCWKGFKSAKDAGKPENVQDLEDFSEEKRAVELLRRNKGFMKLYHKTNMNHYSFYLISYNSDLQTKRKHLLNEIASSGQS